MTSWRARGRETPFIVGVLLMWAVAIATLPFGSMAADALVEVGLAAVLYGAVVLWAAVTDWSPKTGPSPWWPPLALIGISTLVFASLDDPKAGFGPMTLLPIVWLAMYGTRRQLWVSIAFVAALAGAWVVFRSTSLTDGRPALIWVGVSSLVGWAVHGVVRERAAHAAALSSTHAALRAATSIAHQLGSDRDVRRQVCAAIRDVANASFAALVEPDDTGALVPTAETDDRLQTVRVAVDEPACGISRAFRTGERQVVRVEDATDLVEGSGTRLAVYEPVRGSTAVLGVLIVLFANPADAENELALETIAMLAIEAGIALDRADLVTELARQADTDQLTGLPNRRRWDREVGRALERAAATGEPVCVAIIDLDHFKVFNDTFGHVAGDRLLRAAANGWLDHLRAGDLLARYGGEEFTVLLSGCTEPVAQAVADRLRTVRPYDQTSSVGIARWDGDETAAMLLRRADKALYAAKSAGRDRVMCAV
jgi:diguanylate cyclase (GGDEF)-like protein